MLCDSASLQPNVRVRDSTGRYRRIGTKREVNRNAQIGLGSTFGGQILLSIRQGVMQGCLLQLEARIIRVLGINARKGAMWMEDEGVGCSSPRYLQAPRCVALRQS